MKEPIELTTLDPIIDKLDFKSFKSTVERRFERFLPRWYTFLICSQNARMCAAKKTHPYIL